MGNIASRIYKPSDFSEGQRHEVLVTLGKKGFSPEMAAELANAKSGLAEQVVGLFLKRQNPFEMVVDIPTMLAGWRSFYHKFFNLDLDFSGVRIPPHQPGFDRLIVVAQGLTHNQVYEACVQRFPCWRYTDDLDKATQGLHKRDPKNGSYAIWVRDRIEADEELKNLSANQIKEKGITTETLLERLIHELKYWNETGQHLDVNNITLCSGSRYRDGIVPYARWGGDKFRVDWYYPDSSSDVLRSRQAVS